MRTCRRGGAQVEVCQRKYQPGVESSLAASRGRCARRSRRNLVALSLSNGGPQVSDTVVAVIVTAAVTLVASFGGQWLANRYAAAQADANRRHELRVAMLEVVIEHAAAGLGLSHGMSMLLFASRLGLDAAQKAMDDVGDEFSQATRRFSDAEARVRMSVRDPDLLGPVDAVTAIYRALPNRTSSRRRRRCLRTAAPRRPLSRPGSRTCASSTPLWRESSTRPCRCSLTT